MRMGVRRQGEAAAAASAAPLTVTRLRIARCARAGRGFTSAGCSLSCRPTSSAPARPGSDVRDDRDVRAGGADDDADRRSARRRPSGSAAVCRPAAVRHRRAAGAGRAAADAGAGAAGSGSARPPHVHLLRVLLPAAAPSATGGDGGVRRLLRPLLLVLRHLLRRDAASCSCASAPRPATRRSTADRDVRGTSHNPHAPPPSSPEVAAQVDRAASVVLRVVGHRVEATESCVRMFRELARETANFLLDFRTAGRSHAPGSPRRS